MNNTFTLAGGTLANATVLAGTGGQMLTCTPSGGTLDGVTADGDLDLASIAGAFVYVKDGLTLSNSTVHLGNAVGSTYGYLYFEGTQTLGGTGTVLFGKNGNNAINQNYGGTTLTIGPQVTVRGSSGTLGVAAIVNQGTISADDSGGLAGNFVYDQGFTSGSASDTSDPIDTSAVSNPAPQAVWQTFRYGYGAFGYNLTGLTPGASYTLALDFATSYAAAGQQQFNVGINGTQVLTNFDIFAAAGGKDKAIQKSFTATANTSGQLALAFSPGSSGYAQINGIELLSGGVPVEQIDCGLLAGGTITINPSTFTNQGSLQVGNGEHLNVSGLTGNLGSATLAGSGSGLSLSGANYVVNQGFTLPANSSLSFGGTNYTVNQALAAPAGSTLSLTGSWIDSSTIMATGATLNLGDQASSSTNAWSNTGTISAVNSTVSLGGQFTLAALGTFNRTAGTVNLVGTLNNTGTTLALNATTGSWNLLGGTLIGGTLSESGGAELVFTSSGGTLDGVTAASDLDLASNNGAFAYVKDGLTLSNSTVHLGNAVGSTYGYLYFDRDADAGGHGHGALRQERQQRHQSELWWHHADDRPAGSRCAAAAARWAVRPIVQPRHDQRRRQRRAGRQLRLRPGLQRRQRFGHVRSNRHLRGEQPGPPGGLADLPLRLRRFQLQPDWLDARGQLHGALDFADPRTLPQGSGSSTWASTARRC